MIDLDMGKYAAFVWPAWAISAVVLAALVARAVVVSRRWTAALRRVEADDVSRAQVGQGSVAPETRAQVARSAVAQEDGAQVARSAVAQDEMP